MNTIRSFFLILFGLIVAVVTAILVMTKGWGLEPRNWWWIIGGPIFGNLFAHLLIAIARNEED